MDDRKAKLDPPDWARLFALFALGGTTTRLRAHGLGVLLRRSSERFSYLRAYGFKTDYNCRHIGLNGKLSELNAALAWLSLDLLGEAVTRRQAQVQRYRRALESCGDLVWQKVLPGCVHGYKDLAVKFPTAKHHSAAETALAAAGVMTKRYFFPVHRMEAYRGHALRRLPVTDDLYDRLLCIPVYFDLEDQQIDEIAKHLIEGVRKAARDRSAA